MSRRRMLENQSGLSFPELLVGIAIGLTVAAGAGMMVVIAVRGEPRISERAGQIQQGRAMLERVSRELRQGQSITAASSMGLEILTYVPVATCGASDPGPRRLCLVTYSCDASSCVRTERNPDGTGTTGPRTVVDGITGPNVFSYAGAAGDPSLVALELVFPADGGEEAVTLADAAALRNHFDSTGG